MWGPAALLLLVFLQHSKSDSACKNLRCFADYIQTLTCTWDSGPGASRGKLHNLTATWSGGHGSTSCTFPPTFRYDPGHTGYTCSFFSLERKPCLSGNTFAVMVTTLAEGNPALSQECGPFQCHENVKPQPPFNVTGVAGPGGYNVSWQSGYSTYDYLHGELQYQLRYRQKGAPWSPEGGTATRVPKAILQDPPTLWLLPRELEAGMEYELQVRSGPREHSLYQGMWSDWSPPGLLQTPPAKGPTWMVLAPLLAFSLVATAVAFLCRSQRPWKTLEQLTPSPAPFFQALYLVHNGDFQKWLGPSCAGVPQEVSEGGTDRLQVFQISPKPLLTTVAPGETSPPPPCTTALPTFSQEDDPGCVPELAYGHLSIHTVTVANTGGLEPEAYRCLPLDSGHHRAESLPPPLPPPPRDSGSSGPWRQEACLAPLLEAGVPAAHWSPLDGPTCEGPVSASSSPSPRLFCRKPLSPLWAADGDPGEGLDLDTVDSGFADSDCGSPVDCKCPGRSASCTALGEGATFLPSYVKQWVACHLPLAEHS